MKAGVQALVVAFAFLVATACASETEKTGSESEALSVDEDDTHRIARLTGPRSINRTPARWNVYGTDLGHMFEHRGRLYMAFGDTFGPPGRPPRFGSDWRSNALAFVRDSNPRDGLAFAGMVTDPRGHAKELIGKEDVPGEEVTVIPTYGVSANGRMFLHYMAVEEWGQPGRWSLNRSGLAYSDDDGETWTVAQGASWPGNSNFGQVAFVKHGTYVYVFGIPGGRFGPARLARVEEHELLELERYEYWDGERWVGEEAEAAVVVPAPVGELSVQWNSHYGRWLMMYLNDDDTVNGVVLRVADCLTGRWSEQKVVVTADEVPDLYAPYIPPRWNDGADIFFALSRFDLYDVFWWHTSLKGEPKGEGRAPCISR